MLAGGAPAAAQWLGGAGGRPAMLMQQRAAYQPARRVVCAPLCAKSKGKQQGSSKANKRGNKSAAAPASPQVAQQQQNGPAAAQTATAAPVQQQQQQPPSPQQQQAATPRAAAPQQQQQQQQQPQRPGGRAPLAETPQVVVDRMFRRVVTFAGLPVLTGMLLFPAFWYLRVAQKVEYPIWVVYVTQAFMFGGGLAGISYGILSTSWDPRREGSALGWTELQANLPLLLNRNKEDNN